VVEGPEQIDTFGGGSEQDPVSRLAGPDSHSCGEVGPTGTGARSEEDGAVLGTHEVQVPRWATTSRLRDRHDRDRIPPTTQFQGSPGRTDPADVSRLSRSVDGHLGCP